MENEKDSKYLPRLFGDNCFACGDNPSGLRMKFMPGKESVTSLLEIPKHLCGWKQFAHGGIITTVLDEVMSWAALYLLRKMVMTKKITVEFLKPVVVESSIKAEGKILERKNKREALMEGVLYNKKGQTLARATAVFSTFSPKVGQKLGVIDYDCSNRFEKFL